MTLAHADVACDVSYVVKEGRALILLLNKWDLIPPAQVRAPRTVADDHASYGGSAKACSKA